MYCLHLQGGRFFNPEDIGSRFFQNIDKHLSKLYGVDPSHSIILQKIIAVIFTIVRTLNHDLIPQ
jgi:hypothetical protein